MTKSYPITLKIRLIFAVLLFSGVANGGLTIYDKEVGILHTISNVCVSSADDVFERSLRLENQRVEVWGQQDVDRFCEMGTDNIEKYAEERSKELKNTVIVVPGKLAYSGCAHADIVTDKVLVELMKNNLTCEKYIGLSSTVDELMEMNSTTHDFALFGNLTLDENPFIQVTESFLLQFLFRGVFSMMYFWTFALSIHCYWLRKKLGKATLVHAFALISNASYSLILGIYELMGGHMLTGNIPAPILVGLQPMFNGGGIASDFLVAILFKGVVSKTNQADKGGVPIHRQYWKLFLISSFLLSFDWVYSILFIMAPSLSADVSDALLSITVYVVPFLYLFAQIFILAFLVHHAISFRNALKTMGRPAQLMRGASRSIAQLMKGGSKQWLAQVSPKKKVQKSDPIDFLRLHTLFYVRLSVLAIVIGIFGILLYAFMIAYLSPEMWFVFSFLICLSRLLKIYSNTKICQPFVPGGNIESSPFTDSATSISSSFGKMVKLLKNGISAPRIQPSSAISM